MNLIQIPIRVNVVNTKRKKYKIFKVFDGELEKKDLKYRANNTHTYTHTSVVYAEFAYGGLP